MDKFQKDITNIIRSSLTGEKSSISHDFNLSQGISLARKHNIIAMFYYGILLCGVSPNNSIIENLRVELYQKIIVSEQQIYEINILMKAFNKQKIDYLPLKGTVLKSIYPKPEMRSMGDADILIKTDQYSQITEILKNLNYTFKYESNHELVWTNTSLLLELHKSIITTYNKDFYKYFNTGWEMAKITSNTSTKYGFTPEDFYIYIFVHFTNHYRVSGIGIKHIVDLWVYKNSHPNMDTCYISTKLKNLKLYEFHQNIVATLSVWFENADHNEKTDYITNVIFSSGQYGTTEMAAINSVLRDSKTTGSITKSKSNKIINTVFLPYLGMCKDYPILHKFPILLPVMWVTRATKIMLFRRKDIHGFIKNIKLINKSSVNEHQNALNYVGLDFNFKDL